MTFRRCACNALWIILQARGEVDDGVNLGEDLQATYSILEHAAHVPIEVHTGSSALSALRRTFTEISGDRPRFAGIELKRSDAFGSNNMLVVGTYVEAPEEDVDMPPFDVVAGAEYQSIVGSVWTVNSIEASPGPPVPDIIHATRQADSHTATFRMPEFKAGFKPYVRRSATDRLLNDEDLV